MNKTFLCFNLTFVQRPLDTYIDATLLCQTQNKMFANWFRSKKAKNFLKDYENPIIKSNRHTWISSECLKPLVDWLLKIDYDYTLIEAELAKPFEEKEDEPPVTSKICSKCKEDLSLDNFGPNKRMKDGYDRRCKGCYKEDRQKNSAANTERSLEYYHNNKEKCGNSKLAWQRKNRNKTRAANNKAYAKKKAIKAEEKARKESEEEDKKEEVLSVIENSETKKITNNLRQIVLNGKNNKSYQVICREDGYIDITNLCKAGGKQFKHWHECKKTKRFLEALETKLKNEDLENNAVGIPTALTKSEDLEKDVIEPITLIKYKTGRGSEQGTWVHPRVAINIAQWISPEFDIQVSGWIHQLLVVGQVRLTDKVTDKELIDLQVTRQKYNQMVHEEKTEEALEIGDKIKEKLQILENRNLKLARENERLSKYLERKRRIQYDDKKVIYIIKHDEFENCYKVGIANRLTTRMSTYNTGAPKDYEVLYYHYTMFNSTIELMIKKKFVQYLYTHNKEWYQLEDGYDILVEHIQKAVEFFET